MHKKEIKKLAYFYNTGSVRTKKNEETVLNLLRIRGRTSLEVPGGSSSRGIESSFGNISSNCSYYYELAYIGL